MAITQHLGALPSKTQHYNWQKNALALAIASLGTLGLNTLAHADGRVEGYITAANEGIALQGAQVKLKELNREAVSQRDGRFVFLDVEAGEYTLETRYLGADTQSQTIRVIDNQTLQAQVALKRGKGPVENILVIGQAAGINKALNHQRSADNIITVVSADAIGQFPDTNVSEALQRLPGLSIERDQGEGRYVRVRGMSPDYNAVTINGVGVPAPDADRRAVALDVIPSDLLENLVVTKSLTPDMDANSLGGSIDVQSLSAFDRDGFFYQLSAEGSYDENSSETSPKASLTSSNRFSVAGGQDNFGVAAGISYFKRDFGSDNIETGGAWDFDDGEAKLEELEQRDYEISRKRTGLTLNLDYKANDNTSLFWRNLYSEYTDAEVRHANAIEFADAISPSESAMAEVTRKYKARTETQKILSSALGGQTHFKRWTMDYQLALSKSGEDEPLHIGGANFEVDGDKIADEGFTLAYNNSDEITLNAPAAYYLADNYQLAKVELATNNTNDQASSFNLDFTRELELGTNPAMVKFGGKHQQRKKDNDTQESTQKKFTATPAMPAFSDGEVDYKWGNFGPHINNANLMAMADNTKIDDEASSINDFEVTEDVSAAYLMGRIDINRWRLLTGMRYETTDFSADGFAYDADAETLTAQHFNNSHAYLLPALHVRYSLSDATQVRAAWTNSVVRPSFGQLSPGRLTEEDDGDIDTSFGNPNLKPLESSNIDLGIEHYTGAAGVLSAFMFYKSIDNFAYATDLAGSAGYEDFHKAETYTNGQSAELLGLELAASQPLRKLPKPWNGLLVGANATFVDSSAEIGGYDDGAFSGRDVPMPSQSDLSANLMVGYESNRVSLRLSANYKSSYLQEVLDPLDSRYDVYVDDQLQVDFSARYFITDTLKVYFEALNLTDEIYYTYVKSPRYNAQYESYGATYKIGLSLMSF